MDIGKFIREIEELPQPAFPQEWIDEPVPEKVEPDLVPV